MNWIIAALAAAAISGTSAIFDKLLLRERWIGDPIVFTIGAGILSAAALFLLLFDPTLPALPILAAALLGGAVFLAALFLFFSALKAGEASGAFPIIGGLAPMFTLALAALVLHSPLSSADLIGFSLIVGGSVILLGVEERGLRLRVLLIATASAFLFGIANILRKITLTETSFLAGVAWLSAGGALIAILLLLVPSVRHRLRTSVAAPRVTKGLWFLNRAWATFGTIILLFAISLGHPALVDASQGFRYVVVFFGAWLLLGERFSGWVLLGKSIATVAIILGLAWLSLVEYARGLPLPPPERPITWGVTFSQKFSRELGLDWQDNFQAVLKDLGARRLRLVAYWDEIERQAGSYDFSDLDFELERARETDAKAILVIGLKVPRWPECHIPEWARPLSVEAREEALRTYLQRVVERYRSHPVVTVWQVENEPFLPFGQCPTRGSDFVRKEVRLVRSLDPERPILVTDGGEFGLWHKAARSGDVFGTTMYRKVYPRFIGPLFGVIEYPIAPGYFRLKERVVRWLNRDPEKRFIVSELQAEPWGPGVLLYELDPEEQVRLFSPEYFRDTIEYAKAAGFDEYYLWGAEWWWFMKEKHDDSRYWDLAKTVLASP